MDLAPVICTSNCHSEKSGVHTSSRSLAKLYSSSTSAEEEGFIQSSSRLGPFGVSVSWLPETGTGIHVGTSVECTSAYTGQAELQSNNQNRVTFVTQPGPLPRFLEGLKSSSAEEEKNKAADLKNDLTLNLSSIAESYSSSETVVSDLSPLSDRVVIDCLIGADVRIKMEAANTIVRRLSLPTHSTFTPDSDCSSTGTSPAPTRRPSTVFPILEEDLDRCKAAAAKLCSSLSDDGGSESSDDSGFASSACLDEQIVNG